MTLHSTVACYPVLEKLEGDDLIPSITPVLDAQLFIGKAWDASLKVSRPDVLERHCTIERVELEKWTVVAHEFNIVDVNNVKLLRGLPSVLKFGDVLRICSTVSFQFTCSCNFDFISHSAIKKRKYTPLYRHLSQPTPQTFQLSENEDWKSLYQQSLNENFNLSVRLKKAEDVATFWENEKCKTEELYSTTMESYKRMMEKYSQLRQLKEELERNQDSDMKPLRDTVSSQAILIENLKLQLGQLQRDFHNVDNFKHNLEEHNKQLSTENGVLHSKVEKSFEYVKMLYSKNLDLQTEIRELKEKKNELQTGLESKINPTNLPGLKENDDVSPQISESNLKTQNSLTELLETEFKCSICDEVFIEAVVTNCAHMFCSYCIKSWKFIKPNCPICRTILTKEVKVLTIDSFLASVMSLVTENLRTNWLKVSEERKTLKDTAKTKPIECIGLSLHPPSTSSSSASDNVGNFHTALMNVYRHLMHYEDVIDLTNDRIYGL